LTGFHDVVVVKVDRKYMCSTYDKQCTTNANTPGYEEHEVAELKDMFHCERSCQENDGSFTSIIHQRVPGGAGNGAQVLPARQSTTSCQHCACYCKKHPPCEGQEGKELANDLILGNHWENIGTRQECCNMCTNHKQCGSFTYTQDGDCKLYSGAAVFKPAGESTTFSGCRFGAACNLGNTWSTQQQQAAATEAANAEAADATASAAAAQMVKDWQPTAAPVNAARPNDALANAQTTDLTVSQSEFAMQHKGDLSAFNHYNVNAGNTLTAQEILAKRSLENGRSPFAN